MRRTPHRSPRDGFTLVELMVAMALAILIMAILSAAFQVGLGTMSELKSVVGLSEQLRAAEAVITRDLSAVHLEDEWARPVRVSALQVQQQGWTAVNQKRGVFKVRQVSPRRQNFNPGVNDPAFINDPHHPFLLEGIDANGVASHRATDHVLHLTACLPGVSADQVFFASAPAIDPPGNLVASSMNRHDLRVGNQFISDWAEVAYFLRPTGLLSFGDDEDGGKTLRLHTLYRRQRVLTPAPFDFSQPLDQNQFPGVSVPPVTGSPTNDPLRITNLANRLPTDAPPGDPFVMANIASTSPEYGSDVLLSNVISFQIRMQFEGVPGFQDEWVSVPPAGDGSRTYDTAANAPKPRPLAIQIKLRVYDTRNKMTRQMTITQDL
jgi:type II secretory pathway pseudopilin PulG